MIEEPYRWVEAISNRREYIEDQLATGSPIACIACQEGILFLTLGRERRKIFEIYDRIAMGAIGHPGDIERLRMAAIEVASTEGFARSVNDVSLRRLSAYSLSPALKSAFEQVYGAPYLARLLFAELGRPGEANLFLRLEYDGSMHTNGGMLARTFEEFGVISGTRSSTALMEKYLGGRALENPSLIEAAKAALGAWSVGDIALAADSSEELPTQEAISARLRERLALASVEGALLERSSSRPACYRPLSVMEVAGIVAAVSSDEVAGSDATRPL